MIPPLVLGLGLFGLVPFMAPPLVGMAVPELNAAAASVQAVYAALILSFLGGARWGLAVTKASPRSATIVLAMLPSLAAWATLLLVRDPSWQLAGMAALLVLHWGWDAASTGLPGWYPPLRGILTLGAVAGLLGEVVLLA